MNESKRTPMRLGLDIGTNSIGWALLETDENGDPIAIKKMGVRIFSDGRNPKDGTSLAVARRVARQSRRRRKRFKQRTKAMMNQMIRMGLFPADKNERLKLKGLDPIELRMRALNHRLSAHELGRAIFHLNQKRGFQSGRKENPEDAKNKISDRIKALEQKMSESGARTYGEYLWRRRNEGLTTKATDAPSSGFYPVRALLAKEFDILVESQRSNLTNVSGEEWARLRKTIFEQRPLRPVERGNCGIYPDKQRAFRYIPSFEYYRVLGELWSLRYRTKDFREHELTSDQILELFSEIKEKRELSFKKIKQRLGLDLEVKFSIEDLRDKLKGCPVSHFFAKEGVLGKNWSDIGFEQQDQIAMAFFQPDTEDEFDLRLGALNIEESLKDRLRATLEKVPSVSETTCAFSEEALRRTLSLLTEERRSPAAIILDLKDQEVGERQYTSKLGYYARVIPESVMPIPVVIAKNKDVHLAPDERAFGRIANPTVHIGLNQLRRVVNEIVADFGVPRSIHVEFARDLKMSKARKDELQKRNLENKKRNDLARELIEQQGQALNFGNMERAKLWLEMSDPKCCVYSGRPISQTMVFSEQVEVDHILPFSRTLDDGLSNKVLVIAAENRAKRNRTPFEAFGGDLLRYDQILSRADHFRGSKSWRFAEGAMAKFETQNGWLARQLTDTSYLAKIARKYLGTLIPEKDIVCVPGRMTALLRAKWGLGHVLDEAGGKNRGDHRHHALDALVVALTDRSQLQRVSRASEASRGQLKIDPPWADFFEMARVKMNEIFVSHRPDHGKNGALLEDTCFGIVEEPNAYAQEKDYKLVTRKHRSALKDSDAAKIRDVGLREMALKNGLASLPANTLKLRVFDVSSEDVEKFGSPESALALIQHGNGKTHRKLYKKGDVHHIGIWRMPSAEGYKFVGVKTFDYMTRDYTEFRPHPAAKLVTKICKRDVVALEENGKLGYFLVASLRPSNRQIKFLKLNQAGEVAGEKQFLLTYGRLQKAGFRKIYVSPSGKVMDRGPIL